MEEGRLSFQHRKFAARQQRAKRRETAESLLLSAICDACTLADLRLILSELVRRSVLR